MLVTKGLYNNKLVSLLHFLVIFSPPLPVNASLDSTAEFNCVCHYCSGQYWLVNDEVVGNSQGNGVKRFGPTVFSNGSKLYALTMPASVQLNESTVQCVVYNGSNPHIESSVVKLLVQGNNSVFLCKIIHKFRFIIRSC